MTRPVSKDFRHETPADLRAVLDKDEHLRTKWEDLTSLARNEWICWVTSAKKQETREKRFGRLQEEILDGKRRPCCWPGCPHRRESAQKWFDR
ncbi:YdeI/OmpD-associated family protein [Parasphingopyxis marina]|uniref:YdeI/OmpD-associated family protein n=1 Tax=Parasphingopyxis marina TaxID=2761622 RepID=A0A842HYH0_9SPHN|nr:YdeI/OmpD-associated family protein [Parasphingopyxis marina]MBC2777517.1 YdeI/OmpD-associated family protein [Parasphingopyxis marina]